MHWANAIQRNRAALHAIVETLFAMLGLRPGGRVGPISRALHRAVLRVLVPAESAARRLIVIAARGLVAGPARARPMPQGRAVPKTRRAHLAFPLFDRRKRFTLQRRPFGAPSVPRVRIFNADPRVAALGPAGQPNDAATAARTEIDSQGLCRRLHALKRALDDLPRQARRFARWRAKQKIAGGRTFASSLRMGRPPGHRCRPDHAVDRILRECHGLARDAMADTS